MKNDLYSWRMAGDGVMVRMVMALRVELLQLEDMALSLIVVSPLMHACMYVCIYLSIYLSTYLFIYLCSVYVYVYLLYACVCSQI